MNWQTEGREPDYRFFLANERTFLAWLRTALALLASGVLLDQFATELAPPGIVVAASVALIVMAVVMCATAYQHWKKVQIAMRMDALLPATWLPLLVACVLGLVCALAVVLVLS